MRVTFKRCGLSHSVTTPIKKNPRFYWDDINNQRSFLQDVAERANLTIPDLCRQSKMFFRKQGGTPLLERYQFSLYKMFTTLYPNITFSPLAFTAIPDEFLHDTKLKRLVLDEFATRFNIQSPEQWLSIRKTHLKHHGLEPLIKQYESVDAMLQQLYHEVDWKTLKLNQLQNDIQEASERVVEEKQRKPAKFWDDTENQRQFLIELGKKLELKKFTDWSSITVHQIRQHGGRQLLKKYPSFHAALCALFPEEVNDHTDDHAVRDRAPRNYWRKIENQRLFLEFIKEKFGLTETTQLLNISVSELLQHGGSRLLKLYATYFDLLQAVYPEENWDYHVEQLQQRPRKHWNDTVNIESFLEKIRIKYRIKEKEDWYRVSLQQIISAGSAGILRKYGTLEKILSLGYPNEKWSSIKISRRDKRSRQRWLYLQLQEMFPGDEIVEEFEFLKTDDNGNSLQLDVFVPKYALAFEYQGEHHYEDNPFFGQLEMYMARDKHKLQICRRHDINLVAIPYWWDGSQRSLAELVFAAYPSLNLPGSFEVWRNAAMTKE